jgi:Rha family phage regulatory protein
MSNLVLADVVKAEKEAVITNSKIVAEIFEKQHKNVLRHIESLMKDSETLALGFEECSAVDSWNRTQKMYNINRDGFMLLIFGFTGEKAKAVKLSFIEAFNKMEDHIRSQKQTIFNPTRLEFAQMLLEAEQERAKLEEHNAILEHTVGV